MPKIVLVGFRACGKTTVARLLQDRFGWPAFDADAEIVAATGRSIPEIFASEGETGFRRYEQEHLASFLRRPAPWVLSTGGGVVTIDANREELKTSDSCVFYLQASLDLVQARLRRRVGPRPSLTGSHPAEEAAVLLPQREPWYRGVADHVVPIDGDSSKAAAAIAAIVENMTKRG